MKTAKVKFFNSVKGFGFITPDDGSGELFYHISEVDGQEILEVNDFVTYEVGQSKKGQCAKNMKRI